MSENALQIKTNVAKLATKCNRTWSSRILPGQGCNFRQNVFYGPFLKMLRCIKRCVLLSCLWRQDFYGYSRLWSNKDLNKFVFCGPCVMTLKKSITHLRRFVKERQIDHWNMTIFDLVTSSTRSEAYLGEQSQTSLRCFFIRLHTVSFHSNQSLSWKLKMLKNLGHL